MRAHASICLLLVLCMSACGGREWSRSRSRRDSTAQVFRIGSVAVGCAMLTSEEADRLQASADGSGLASRIASRRPSSSRRPSTSRRPTRREYCPNGVTYFDGCNSCSCGTDKLCTLKACNADTTVQIYDPCQGVTCGYHQRCQAICVGQLCQLRPLCVSDDHPSCHNCPWLCVDERLNCSDNFSTAGCKPTLACYRPNE